MRRALARDDYIAEAAEETLQNETLSPHPNLVTQTGLKALERKLQIARAALDEAQTAEKAGDKNRRSERPLRDIEHYSELLRTAQVVTPQANPTKIGFGHLVSVRYDDGREFTLRIVGEDEADPPQGKVSFVSPVAQKLMGLSVGGRTTVGEHEIEILDIF